jgi:hypothetical protein
MTNIAIESFKEVGVSALKIPSEQVQNNATEKFDAVIAKVAEHQNQDRRNLEISKDLTDLFNKGLAILPELLDEASLEKEQDETTIVGVDIELLADMMSTEHAIAEVPALVVPVQTFNIPNGDADGQGEVDEAERLISATAALSQQDLRMSAQQIDDARVKLQKESVLKDNAKVELNNALQAEELQSSEVLQNEASLKKIDDVLTLNSRNDTLEDLRSFEHRDQKPTGMDVTKLEENAALKINDSKGLKDPTLENAQLSSAQHGVEVSVETMNPTEWSLKVSHVKQDVQLKELNTSDSEVLMNADMATEAEIMNTEMETLDLEAEQSQPKSFNPMAQKHDIDSQMTRGFQDEETMDLDNETIEIAMDVEQGVALKTEASNSQATSTTTSVGDRQGEGLGQGLDVDPKQQIARTILEVKDTLAPKEVKTLTLSLNPEALGQVNVELVSDEAGKIHVSLAVLKAETFETLQQDFSQLKTILSEIGIEDGNVSLQLSSGNEQQQHQKEEYVSWEQRESMLMRQPSPPLMPVEITQAYLERKNIKRLDIKA